MTRPGFPETCGKSANMRSDAGYRDDLPLMVVAVFIAALILGLIGGALALSAIERAAHDAHQIRTLGYVAMMEMGAQP